LSDSKMNCQIPLCRTSRELYSGLVDASKLDTICDECLPRIQEVSIPADAQILASNVCKTWAGLQSMRWCEGLNRHQHLSTMFSVQILESKSIQRWCKQLGAVHPNFQSGASVDSVQFNDILLQSLKCTLFAILCKNYLMHTWKQPEHASHLSKACCANTNIGPPLLGAGNPPEKPIIEYTTQELTTALEALDVSHQKLTLCSQTILFLESLCLRTAVQMSIEEDTDEWAGNVIAPYDDSDSKFCVADAERIWSGVIVELSGFSVFASGRLVSVTTMQALGDEIEDADKTFLQLDQVGVDDNWQEICTNLQKDILQAAAQAPAQRPIIAVRQEVCIGAMLPYGYSAGVMRALTSLERQGRDKAAQMFQTMTYRKPDKLWGSSDGLEQSVAMAVIRAALVFQHGVEAGGWFDQVVPWRTLDGACVLNRFGRSLRRTALAYVVDACYDSLHSINLETKAPPVSLVSVLLFKR
jgi:hypothetical protein